MDDCVVFQDEPELVSPYMLIGFSGWLNAGAVATGCIDYLRRKLNARKFAHIDPRGFYIYQVPAVGPEQTLRPHARIEDGLITQLDLPKNEFFYWKSGGPHDLILFSGVEPNLEWPVFIRTLLDVAGRYQASRLYSLGGVFDQVPHTRETRLFAVLGQRQLKEEVRKIAAFLSYEGPCSFSTTLLSQAGRQGIEAAGVTARVPPYIQNYNPRACYDLLRRVFSLSPVEIDLSDLKKSGESLIVMMDKAFGQNEDALEQLKKLEELYDAAALQEISRTPGQDYDKLLEEMLNMKREGRKPH